MARLFNNRVTRWVLAMVVLICLLGAAFYGGRVYQNSADQSLFDQYNPTPQTGQSGTGRSFSFTGGSSTNLVGQALTVGTPPPLTPQASGSASTTVPPAGGTPVPGTGSASPTGAAASSIGTLVSLSSTALAIQTFQGTTVTARVTTTSRFYLARTAALSALAAGQHVAIGTDRADPTSTAATSVTISPAGAPYASVRIFAGGGGGAGGGFGGGAGGGAGGSGRAPGGTPGGGAFGGGAAVPTGTIVKVSSTALTLQTSTGTKTFSLTSATPVYQLSPASAAKMKTGVRTAVSLQGQGSAAAVAAAAQPSGNGFVSFVS